MATPAALDDRTLGAARDLADRLAVAAGRTIRAGLTARTLSYKPDGSEVTDVDVAINAEVIEAVASAFPDHQVLGEESSGSITDLDGPTWVVDPVDGTMPYSAGVGVACFSLALVVAGDVVLAAVEDPWAGFSWRSTRGGGTWRNGTRCTTSPHASLDGARIDVEADAEYAALSGALTDAGALAFCQWAVVRTACAVADGGYHGCVYGPGNPWDVAATTLLVAEAGGKVAQLDGTPLHAARPTGRWIATGSPQLWDHVAAAWSSVL